MKWFIQTVFRWSLYIFLRLLHVRNGNCKYHLGEETFKLAQSYMDKLAKHGQQANKAALYGELCALLFAKSHYDEVSGISLFLFYFRKLIMKSARTSHDWLAIPIVFLLIVFGSCVAVPEEYFIYQLISVCSYLVYKLFIVL